VYLTGFIPSERNLVDVNFTSHKIELGDDEANSIQLNPRLKIHDSIVTKVSYLRHWVFSSILFLPIFGAYRTKRNLVEVRYW